MTEEEKKEFMLKEVKKKIKSLTYTLEDKRIEIDRLRLERDELHLKRDRLEESIAPPTIYHRGV